MLSQELSRIGQILNCGGKGGTPGPCPLGGVSDIYAEKRALAAKHAALSVPGLMTVRSAKYAKGKVAINFHDGEQGFKGRGARLADALKMKWTNRERAYITSEAKAKKLAEYYKQGYDGGLFGDLMLPGTSIGAPGYKGV